MVLVFVVSRDSKVMMFNSVILLVVSRDSKVGTGVILFSPTMLESLAGGNNCRVRPCRTKVVFGEINEKAPGHVSSMVNELRFEDIVPEPSKCLYQPLVPNCVRDHRNAESHGSIHGMLRDSKEVRKLRS